MPHAILERLVRERDQANETINDILDQAEAGERDPSESERALITRQRARLDELEPQIVELVELEERRSSARDAHALLTRGSSEPRGDGGRAPVPTPAGPQPMVYRTFAHWARDELIVRYPSIGMQAGDGAVEHARERLARAVLTPQDPGPDLLMRQAPPGSTVLADIPGLLPPQHLTQIMQIIDRSRPLVVAARDSGLTGGRLTYPQIDVRPQVGEQTGGEKTELPIRAMKVSMQELVAKVYGGAGDLSWQDLNWTSPNALQLWFDLAAEAYAEQTEMATAAAMASIVRTVQVAADDLAGWMDAITAAAGLIAAPPTKRAPNALITDTTIGYHLLGMVSHQQPVFLTAGPGNLAQGSGTIAGLRLIISYGFAQPRAFVGVVEQILRGETPGSPVQMRAVEPSIAGMEVGIIGAYASKVIELGAFVRLLEPAGMSRVAVSATPDTELEAGEEADNAEADAEPAEAKTTTRNRR